MFNSWFPESKDRLPLTWWKQRPIYLAAFIAIIGAVGTLSTIMVGGAVKSWLAFSFGSAFSQWHLWTLLTYILVNPTLWTLFHCYLIWNFGEAVERHLGRRVFVRLLLVLWLAAPLFVSVLYFAGFQNLMCAGIRQLALGLLIAFATLYPRAKLNVVIVTLDAWVLATIVVGVDVLGYLGAADWTSLVLVIINVGMAYAFTRFEKGELGLPSTPKQHFKTASSPPTRADKLARPVQSKGPSVDDILDKISRQGMQSLTAEERRILDAASEEMKKRAR